MVTAFPK